MSTTGRRLRFRALRRSVRQSGLEFWRTAGAQRIGADARFCLCEVRVLNIHTRPTYTEVSQWDFRGPGLPVLVTRRYGLLAFLRKNTIPCRDCSANTSRRGFRREMPYASNVYIHVLAYKKVLVECFIFPTGRLTARTIFRPARTREGVCGFMMALL